jgi:hypothetical protein
MYNIKKTFTSSMPKIQIDGYCTVKVYVLGLLKSGVGYTVE